MFVSMLDDLGPEELHRRWGDARRLIHDNGITHNVYGDESGLERPWNLDAVPLAWPSRRRWAKLSGDLQQRATLLGPPARRPLRPARVRRRRPGARRTALHQPRVPAALPTASTCRRAAACTSTPPTSSARPAGAWRVLMRPHAGPVRRGVHAGKPHRPQPRAADGLPPVQRATAGPVLRHPAPDARRPGARQSRQPTRRLLTPGPYSETYFEHAYLARYLGYTLVQGNDLTVRDEKVFLKTLGGLQRVDVIFRRVEDDLCDPLELNVGSYLGVPGLLQAVREGNVAVANSLGSGVLQAAGFLPYLPGLCRFLLGEELKAESVRTWWCGDAASKRYVLERLPTLVVKSAFPSRGADPTFGAELSRDALTELAGRIEQSPASSWRRSA